MLGPSEVVVERVELIVRDSIDEPAKVTSLVGEVMTEELLVADQRAEVWDEA